MLIWPVVERCPQDVTGDDKLILNIIINASNGNLGGLTVEKITKYSQLDVKRVSDAINLLAEKMLIHVEEWV